MSCKQYQRNITAKCFKDLRFRKFSRSEEHTSELQSQANLVCRLLLEKKKRCCPHPPASDGAHMAPSQWMISAAQRHRRHRPDTHALARVDRCDAGRHSVGHMWARPHE